MADDITLLYHEILDKVHKAKTKKEKVHILKKYKSDGLKMVIKSSFDPKIEWAIPEGDVPFEVNGAPDGTEHTRLATESKKLWHFIKGADRHITQNKREYMYIQLLEGLSAGEARVLNGAKDKALHRIYKGLSADVVKEAFGWNDGFMIPDPNAPKETYDRQGNRIVASDSYPQASGSANGVG